MGFVRVRDETTGLEFDVDEALPLRKGITRVDAKEKPRDKFKTGTKVTDKKEGK